MPVYVRWQWKEKTKTFLVIFYFFDDHSSSNMRFRLKVIGSTFIEDMENNPDMPPQPIMTWAPTHIEIALLGDVLRYANIIDGLGVFEKKKLRKKLEIQVKNNNPNIVHEEMPENLVQDSPTLSLLSLERDEDWFFCCKLNMEYIEFLKAALQPFLDIK